MCRTQDALPRELRLAVNATNKEIRFPSLGFSGETEQVSLLRGGSLQH